jgi:D-3-phosphoglycerate dehydrogenase
VRTLILAPFSEEALARLRRRVDVVHESWLETRRLQDPDELGVRLRAEGYAALVVEADFVFEETFAAAADLRLVGVCRNALNQVDVASATRHGVAVTHAPGRNTNAVAELVLAQILSLFRTTVPAHAYVSGGGWRDPSAGYREFRGREIAGATVGVVGFGRIGREVARKCLGLGARVLACDPLVPERQVRAFGAMPASMDEVARRSDVVTLHVPDSESTRHVVDARFIAQMRRQSYLVNTSGGAAVDAAALAKALHDGAIAGAALDVFEGQPLPLSSPLLAAPNLLLTPHIGGATDETVARHSEMIAADIERFVDGVDMAHLVNPEYRLARAG